MIEEPSDTQPVDDVTEPQESNDVLIPAGSYKDSLGKPGDTGSLQYKIVSEDDAGCTIQILSASPQAVEEPSAIDNSNYDTAVSDNVDNFLSKRRLAR